MEEIKMENQQTNSQQLQQQVQESVDSNRIFMRAEYAFFGGMTALYALFYTFCLYKNVQMYCFCS